MKFFAQISLACLLLMAATASASAQVMVISVYNNAHECYEIAKAGNSPLEGIDFCNQALMFEHLTGRDLAATYDNRGVLETAAGQIDRAFGDFNTAIDKVPTLGDAYVNRGSILIRREKYADAIVDINKGMGLDPTLPEVAYFNRAVAEQQLAKYTDAYYDYKHALQIDPQFIRASEMLKDFVVTTKPANAPTSATNTGPDDAPQTAMNGPADSTTQ